MINFIEYVVSELKSKRLSKTNALALIKQYSLHSSTSAQAYIHPLLHSNTSDLTQQSYTSIFNGEEPFLKDHQVNGQKVLPGAAYLEMIRAAVEKAMPFEEESTIIELRNIVWVQPIVVRQKKQVSIALFATDAEVRAGEVEFEVYSTEKDAEGNEQETIHCQGQARFINRQESERLDRAALKAQMSAGTTEGAAIYPIFKKLGLDFGISHQTLTAIYKGEQQLLADISLPSAVNDTLNDYLLHPGLIDGALQTPIGLIADLNNLPERPALSLPFALESMRIISGCTKEMFAWVRFSPGGKKEDKVTKMDIDLCDQEGNVCVQLRGFSLRVISAESITAEEQQEKRIGTVLAAPAWELTPATTASANGHHQEHAQHIVLIGLSNIDDKKIAASVAQGYCHKLPLPQKNIAERYSEIALACFELIQKILKDKAAGKVMFQIVVADHADSAEGRIFIGLSGLLKSAALENPRFTGQVILAGPEMTSEELAACLNEEKSKPQDKIIKYTKEGRFVARLKEVEATQDKAQIAFKDQGVYLITGGLGGLGVLFAGEILKQTTRAQIILTGRSALGAEKQGVFDQLNAGGTRVVYKQLDITNPVQVKQLVEAVRNEYGQLNGIIHSAGIISDNFILKKTAAEFVQVMEPKVAGTVNLDEASQDIDLDFLVLFSSSVSMIGNIGQADYAAANGFMDQFAAYRNQLAGTKQRKGKTLSINWPLWLEGGMRIDKASQDLLKQNSGMQPMRTQTGLNAFYQGLVLPQDQTLVVEGDVEKLRDTIIAGKTMEAPTPSPVAAPAAQTANVKTDGKSIEAKTQDYLRKEFSSLLKLSVDKIDPQAPLEKYGIDSILAMELTSQLEKTFGVLSKTLFFEYLTIRELTGYFITSYADKLAAMFASADNSGKAAVTTLPAAKPEVKAASATKVVSSKRSARQRYVSASAGASKNINSINADPIAIVGLSGRYPEAINIEEYWNNLRDGKDCITEVPKERWDWREYYSEDRSKSGHHYSKWGGFISGVDEFDPRFFNISPREAILMDPQERLFLQHSWMAIEDAGYTRASLQIPHEHDMPGQVGVYVGVMYGEYQFLGAESSMNGKRMGIPGSYASISNRVSYVLNLHGPSMTLDTMCSSSLTAIHLACQDLKLGRTNLAIAGGVNVTIHPNKYLVLSGGQFISSNGHCQSFGEGGDGYIPGEGVGAVVLKRLSEAVRDGNHIYGVIKGCALNHGGKTNGYSVPNLVAQASVVSSALAESDINPRHISYIEAHGTGTKLGDPIEIAALSKAFQPYTQDTGFCLIGSAKSNIGHAESAAGIAGLTKVLLQMKYRKIVPSLHSVRLNPHIDFGKTPFVVNQKLKEWEQPVVDGKPVPRIAAISSFGAGGANAHIIIEEYVPSKGANYPVSVSAPGEDVIIPLSARTEEQLKQKVRDLLSFIRTSLSEASGTSPRLDLVALAYTLQVGREAMNERIGFIANSVEHLAEKLQACVNGVPEIEDFYFGQVTHNKGPLALLGDDADFQETINKWMEHKKLSKLVDLWVNGLNLDWSKLYGEVKPSLLSLPAYPFARERYWVDISDSKKAAAEVTKAYVIHPLLHINTSDLSQVSFSSTFTGEELFIADHQMNLGDGARQKALSAAVYLEMVRTAVEQASASSQRSGTLELSNLVWGQPFIANADRKLTVSLFGDDKGQVNYDVYSHENGKETVHCQGQAVYSNEKTTARIDLNNLLQQQGFARLEPSRVYTFFAAMGLYYGPAYQGIASVHKGQKQLVAQVNVPASVGKSTADFVLHPGLLDSVMQAAVCLIADMQQQPVLPFLPVFLDSLRVVSACSNEMYAWIRYREGSNPSDKITKLDIELCDKQGNVCVQMRGLSLQQILINIPQQVSTKVTVPVPVPVPAAKSHEPAKTKPQAIQLSTWSGPDAVAGRTVTAKPQAIQLMDSQLVDTTVVNTTLSKPHEIQLAGSVEIVDIKDSVSYSAKTPVVDITLQPLMPVKEQATAYTSSAHTKEQVQQALITSLAEALYLQPSEIDIDKSFIDLGLDSIVGVEWIKFINKTFGLEISSTKIYDYATIKELTSFLLKELQSVAVPAASEVSLTPVSQVSLVNDAPYVAPPVLEVREKAPLENVSLQPVAPAKEQEAVYTKEQIQQVLITSLADALYLKPSEIDVNVSFIDMGLDSIVGVEWIKFINKRLGLEISSTKIYDYSTIKELASFLEKELKNVPASSLSEVS